MQPLAGITVVTLEHAIAAPFCTRQLADLGARVIKVERPGSGDFARGYDSRVKGLASHFVWTNRAKESLTLDLKHADAADDPRTAARARRRAGAEPRARRRGAHGPFATRRCRERHPKLIVCDISGYGDDPERPGPYRDKKAYDLLIQSESGFLSITGTPDEPAKAGCSIADIAAGMYAYSGILAALIERGRTGRGRRIDISMLESMVEWMGYPLYYAFDGADAAAAHRRRARDDLSVRPVSGRRRRDRHARPAERARVAGVLPARAASGPSSPPIRASRRTLRAPRHATPCARSSSRPSAR